MDSSVISKTKTAAPVRATRHISRPRGPGIEAIPQRCRRAFYLPTSTKLNAGTDALAAAFLETLLQRRNITDGELSKRCGWECDRAFVDQRIAGVPCLPLRWRIEQELGWVSIWSTGGEVELRQRCFEAYGFDPRTAPLPELKEQCRRLGVQAPSIRRQAEWVMNLFAWLAANPCTENKQKAR